MSQQIRINEELLNGGFELSRSYAHDEFLTFVFNRPKSNFFVELTYKDSELVTAEMRCEDWTQIKPETIATLVQFLSANNL